jgi:hypothetical protein
MQKRLLDQNDQMERLVIENMLREQAIIIRELESFMLGIVRTILAAGTLMPSPTACCARAIRESNI